jgi:hypothetical protein
VPPLEAELSQAIAPVRNRLLAQHYSRWLLYASAMAAVAAAAVFLVASFLPKYEVNWLALAAGTAAALLTLLMAGLRQPGIRDVARRADGAGLAERLITCLEFAGQESLLLAALRSDTVRALQAVNWRRRLPWKLPRAPVWTAAAAVALIVALHLFPNPIVQRMLRLQAERDAVVAEAKRLDAAVRVAEAEAERMGRGQEMQRILEQLREELKRARTAREALQAIGKAEDSLDQFAEPDIGDTGAALQEAGQHLMQTPATQQLGESLARRDWQEASRQLEQLASEDFQAISPEERERLARALEQASRSAAQGSEQAGEGSSSSLSQQLAQAARSLTQNDQVGVLTALREASMAVLEQGNLADMASLEREALAAVMSALSAARENVALAAAGQMDRGDLGGLAVLPNQGNQGDLQGSAVLNMNQGGREGRGLQIGGAAPSGDGLGGGDTVGLTSNIGGSGAGRQESGLATRASEVGPAGQAGTDDPPHLRRDYAQIYDPTPRLDTDGRGTLLQGNDTGVGGSVQFQSPEARVAAGQFRPYDQVFAQYEEQAIQSMQRVELPPGVQQLVKSYFSALDPANREQGGTR